VVAALQERLKAINPEAIIATAAHEPAGLLDAGTQGALPLDRLSGCAVHALSSIGDPEGFEDTVRHLGATLVGVSRYPDHHRYTARDWQMALQQAVASGAKALVTTEKDAVRLRALWSSHAPAIPVWIMRVQMQLLSGEELLDARLARVCSR
jgi:tetraacyldisaccharide 4'-kinase